jgi:hypothetical protein
MPRVSSPAAFQKVCVFLNTLGKVYRRHENSSDFSHQRGNALLKDFLNADIEISNSVDGMCVMVELGRSLHPKHCD